MAFKALQKIDWYDVVGIMIIYAISAVLALIIACRDSQHLVAFGLTGIMFLMAGLTFFWQKLKWGARASLLLIALVLAIIFTPFYVFYKVYLTPTRNFRGG